MESEYRYSKQLDELRNKMDVRDTRAENIRLVNARKHYFKRKRSGDYSVKVDAWDEFEREELFREIKKNREKIGDVYMSKRRILVRLSKVFNNIEVEVNDIETVEEFDSEMNWIVDKAFSLIDCLPNKQIDDYIKKPSGQRSVTPKEYQEKTYPTKQSGFTADDITHNFHKGKQTTTLLKGLNDGKITLEQVNSIRSWDDLQPIMKLCWKK